jgi:hypothetical protein
MSLRKPSEINPTLKCLSDPNNPKCETKEEPQPGNTAILNIAKWINIAILTFVVLVY